MRGRLWLCSRMQKRMRSIRSLQTAKWHDWGWKRGSGRGGQGTWDEAQWRHIMAQDVTQSAGCGCEWMVMLR